MRWLKFSQRLSTLVGGIELILRIHLTFFKRLKSRFFISPAESAEE